VFGPNPTCPYAPLKDQPIESVTVLQAEKAIEIYGKKAENGVVIITTKTGKPTPKK
jgi:TonB-dependent SusC/RagA subfamily outer membrane receptor